ncbi:MAG: hypothetical protein NT062_37825, partial [Proteobacteria bacterium]|nr:hypothetical protein [Pseudomonadota bacterium]
AAFLDTTVAQLRRLELYAEQAGAARAVTPPCPTGAIATGEAEYTPAATSRHLGAWLACRQIDLKALDTLVELLDDLVREDAAWREAKTKLARQTRRLVTVTTTAALPVRVAFDATPWLFSYVTPALGTAGILRTDESFGLAFVAVQLHLEPNPVADLQWRDGVTLPELRRAVALEIGVALRAGSFGTDRRFDGPGRFPALFAGLAVHVLPYTSVSFGAAFLDQKRSTLAEEAPHLVVSPYLGVSLQLNLPDLLRDAASPSSHTRAN